MIASRFSSRVSRIFANSVLTTDVARAWRSSVALVVVWVACLLTGHAAAVFVAAPAAQNVAMLDVRGDYRARAVILLALTAMLSLSVFAGTLAGNHVLSATLMIGVLALLVGGWRHLSGDYGANFALASGLLFLLGLSDPGDWHRAQSLMLATCLGGLGGILMQLSSWLVRPQHALRHAVAEAWVAASDLVLAMRTETDQGERCRHDLAGKEGTLRATVDRTLRAIAATTSRRNPLFATHLDDTTQLAARLAMRTTAFHTSLETVASQPGFAAVAPTLDSALRALSSAMRSVALTVIMHRPEQLIALEVRLRRATDLLLVLDGRLAALNLPETEVASVRHLLAHVAELLPEVRTTLGETVDQGSAHSGFALRLPELGGLSVSSLGAWINPSAQIDWVLVRYTLRIAAVMMLAVAVYKGFGIHRGHWIVFTALVVLQPDYGATREKLGQRLIGTLAGSLLGSLLLWVKMPLGWFVFCASVMAFCFAYFLRRRYGLAVFFVTIMIVLMTEAVMPVHLDFTISRLLATLAGGVLALLAAVFLWPKWENEQSPRIIASALRANRKYLEIVAAHLVRGEPFTGPVVLAKREAERANSRASASLQRLLAEPSRRKTDAEQVAALTTYNQRLTRAVTMLGQHLNQRIIFTKPNIAAAALAAGECIESLAVQLESGQAAATIAWPDIEPPPGISAGEALIYGGLTKIVTEIEAMTLAAAPAPAVQSC